MDPDTSTGERAAKAGDRVRVHYVCRLEDGSVFATTRNKEPREFVIGTTSVIPGLQEAVIGMRPGETKTVEIPPEKAYGPYHEAMQATIPRQMIPPELEIGVGVSLRVKHADGHESDVYITKIEDDQVTVDGNHPLAGKRLIMEVELLELLPA